MTYLEEKTIKGKTYYYLTKTSRAGKGWKKTRTYLGPEKPSKEELALLTTPPKYLTKEQASTLLTIKNRYAEHLKKLTKLDKEKLESATLTHFAYNTSAIEGSSMSLPETGYLLEENKTPQGHDLWEIHSALNTKEAYKYIEEMKEINHSAIKKLHKIVMNRILEKELGEYRTVFMKIGVARHKPPAPTEVPALMEKLLGWYRKNKSRMNVFELACLFHIKFEAVHPFRDGNGRVGRLLMNFILLKQGFPILDLPVDKRIEYYRHLDTAQVGKKFKPFVVFAYNVFVEDTKGMGWC